MNGETRNYCRSLRQVTANYQPLASQRLGRVSKPRQSETSRSGLGMLAKVRRKMSDIKPGESAVSQVHLRVLLLEDNPRDAKLMVSLLKSGGYKVQFDVVDLPQSFRKHLHSIECDIILADFNLGQWTALEALEILRASGKDIPLIVVTGSLGDEAAAECIKRGAADFILKDRPARLPAAVQRALEDTRCPHAFKNV